MEICQLHETLNSTGKQIDYVRRSLGTTTIWNGVLVLVVVMLVFNDLSDNIGGKEDKFGQVAAKVLITLVIVAALAYLLRSTNMGNKRLNQAIKQEKQENRKVRVQNLRTF